MLCVCVCVCAHASRHTCVCMCVCACVRVYVHASCMQAHCVCICLCIVCMHECMHVCVCVWCVFVCLCTFLWDGGRKKNTLTNGIMKRLSCNLVPYHCCLSLVGNTDAWKENSYIFLGEVLNPCNTDKCTTPLTSDSIQVYAGWCSFNFQSIKHLTRLKVNIKYNQFCQNVNKSVQVCILHSDTCVTGMSFVPPHPHTPLL